MAAHQASVEAPAKTPVHLWIVGVLALVWNLGGVWDYTATKFRLEFYLSQFPEEMMAWVDAMPVWATAAWAFGVWGAFVGSVLLLLRKKWAVCAYVISLAGLFLGTIYSYLLSNGAELMGTAGMIMNLVIWVIAVLLIFYSFVMSRRGVLR